MNGETKYRDGYAYFDIEIYSRGHEILLININRHFGRGTAHFFLNKNGKRGVLEVEPTAHFAAQ